MKIKRLNLIATIISFAFSTLIFMHACKNQKVTESKSNVTTNEPTTDNTTTSTEQTNGDNMKTAGKKTGKANAGIANVDKTTKMAADVKGYYTYTESAPQYPG